MDAQSGTLASRLEVWQRGIMMVQDFPFTGIGIGTFNVMAHLQYPFFIAAPDELVPHAHNNLLEVAVDLGIPGFIAYVALLTGFVICAVRAHRAAADASVRALVAGLAFGMLAHQTFGLTDAFILGTKPGVVMWVFLALVAAMDARRGEWGIAAEGQGGKGAEESQSPLRLCPHAPLPSDEK
jgi:putative inorganic carbon (HCO3(-)) transporter